MAEAQTISVRPTAWGAVPEGLSASELRKPWTPWLLAYSV